MALRGMAQIANLHYRDSASCEIDVNYVGFNGGQPIEAAMNITVLQADNSSQMGAKIAQAVKDQLANAHGLTIQPSDTVRIFGAETLDA